MSNSFAASVQIYGHRGARSYAPENTLAGYKTALEIGVDWVDMDIGITKDGIIVVTHDIWLNPDIVSENGKFWANGKEEFIKSIAEGKFNQQIEPYLIKNLTFEQLQKYDVGSINPNSPYKKYFPDQVSVPGTHIPSLQMVVDYVNKVSNNQVGFNIEIKNDPQHLDWTVSPKEFADKIYKLLKQNNIVDRVEIQSFDWQPLYELQKLDPKIKTGFLVGADDIKRMKDTDTKKSGLYSGGKLLKDYHNSLPQMVKALGGSCYEPEDIALTKADLDEAHKLGLKVVVWTWPENSGGAFNPKLINQLIDWGVDSITTDDPGRLSSILAARGHHIPKRYEIR
jgi:glycerophosphoryl diester phosphodiesterase